MSNRVQLGQGAAYAPAVIVPSGRLVIVSGIVALDADAETIRGLTYYEHKETPGLGGEVDNPRWKRLWAGRQVFGSNGEPAIEVVRGRAGTPDEDPHRVDGLAGAPFPQLRRAVCREHDQGHEFQAK